MKKRILSLALALIMLLSSVSIVACGNKTGDEEQSKTAPDAFVIMTDQLDGLFNPFFATSANDSTIVKGIATTVYFKVEVNEPRNSTLLSVNIFM